MASKFKKGDIVWRQTETITDNDVFHPVIGIVFDKYEGPHRLGVIAFKRLDREKPVWKDDHPNIINTPGLELHPDPDAMWADYCAWRLTQ